MVNFSVKQWDIQSTISDLKSDIDVLQKKIEDTLTEQQQAIEQDDYEKADTLDMRISQTQKLIEAKDYKIRQMEENNLSQELMKADKWQELSDLMHKSISKVNNIRSHNKKE
jgi:hypothetical protein